MAHLREIKVSRQDDPAVMKRWFENDYFDLFLWSSADQPFHMQLCYGKPRHERAVSWREGFGYFHDGVLSNSPGDMVAKSSILQAGGSFDFTQVNARFLQESQGLETALRKFVLEKLHHFALNGATFPDRPGRIKVRHDEFKAHAGAGSAVPRTPSEDASGPRYNSSQRRFVDQIAGARTKATAVTVSSPSAPGEE